MRIQVWERSTGRKIKIRRADFDEELHSLMPVDVADEDEGDEDGDEEDEEDSRQRADSEDEEDEDEEDEEDEEPRRGRRRQRGEDDSLSPVGDGVRSLMRTAFQRRDARVVDMMRRAITEASEPDRSTARRLSARGASRAARRRTAERTIVSRRQPTDTLYRRLYRQQPEMKDWRTPDLDHWYRHWIQAMVAKDRLEMRRAEDKLDALSGLDQRQYREAFMRATTLEGVLDVSDPTAILSGTGGHLLPQQLANVVEIARDEVAVLPALVAPFGMTSATLRVPTAGAVTAAMAAEGATAAQGESAFASEMLKAQKAQAFMKASVEMVADSAFNLVGIYASRAGKALGALEDVQICTTNGAAPNISEAIAGGNVAEAVSTVLTFEDLVTLYFALPKTYRRNAVWLGNDTTLILLSTLMDGNDRPILSFPTQQPNVVTDAPGAIGTVFNKPAYEVPLADGQLIFGDPQGYGFGRRAGIVAATSEHADFSSDLINFKFTERFDGRIIDDVALKQMAGLATVA